MSVYKRESTEATSQVPIGLRSTDDQGLPCVIPAGEERDVLFDLGVPVLLRALALREGEQRIWRVQSGAYEITDPSNALSGEPHVFEWKKSPGRIRWPGRYFIRVKNKSENDHQLFAVLWGVRPTEAQMREVEQEA